jgi:peroxiredoxin
VTGSKQNKLIADSMQHVLDLRMKEEVDSIMQIIRNNRDNILSADAIYSIFSELSLDELRPYLNESYAYYYHPLMNPVRQYAEGLEKRIAGKPCPDAELQDSENVLHHLRQYTTGKKTLLHFWNLSIYSTKQLKRLRKIHEKYPDLQIVSIAIYQYPKNWRECVEKNQMDWVNLLAPDGWNSPIMQKFGLCSLPEYVLVGADGVIIDAPKNLDEVEKSLRVKEE